MLDISFEGAEDCFTSMYHLAQGVANKISRICRESEREVILMVDEVDKAAAHPVFLSLLGLLREKYLKRSVGRDHTDNPFSKN